MNVVLIVTDDQEAGLVEDHMPYLGGLDMIEFPNAFLSSPLCGPARYNLHIGQRWDRHDVRGNQDAKDKIPGDDSIAAAASAAGVETCFVGKYINLFTSLDVPAGWDHWYAALDEDQYAALTISNDGVSEELSGIYSTDRYAEEAADWIATATEPFFCFVALNAPHDPAIPAARHDADPVTISDPADWNLPNTSAPGWLAALTAMSTNKQNQVREERKDEIRCGSAIDEAIETIWQAVTTKGAAGDTVLIFMTDNGRAKGRKRIATDTLQKRAAYRYSTDPSLRILYPSEPGRTETALVGSLDIPRSILAWLEASPVVAMDGIDLTPLIVDGTDQRPAIEVSLHGNGEVTIPPYWACARWIEGDLWTYHEYETGTKPQQLYNLADDPTESTNLAATATSELAVMQAELEALQTSPLYWYDSGRTIPSLVLLNGTLVRL